MVSKELLIRGIYNQDLEMVKSAFEGCEDTSFVNEPNEFGFLPFFRAVQEDEEGSIISFLLEKGANPYLVDREMKTVVQQAFLSRNIEAMKLLRYNDHVELIQAVNDKDFDKVVGFIESGLSVHTRDLAGNTLLMLACRATDVKTVRFLLEKGANPNHTDIDGYTALMQTFNWRVSLEIADLLVEYGANVHATNKHGENVSSFASAHNLEALMWCVDHKVDLFVIGNYQFSTLTTAAKCADFQTVTFLLEFGLNPNHLDEFNKTPLHWTAERSLKMTQEMVNHGADISLVDRFGNTPRDCAERDEKDSVVKYLESKAKENL